MKLIAITGGIGSGKSVVARIVQVMGYQVYDCDSRAKALMTESRDVKGELIEAFGTEVYMADGSLNRKHLSAVAFTDEKALARLNGIVHPATARDMLHWAESQATTGAQVAFVETALLRTAGLDLLVDDVWHVTAPDDVRVARVMVRSGLTAQQVRDRMASQLVEDRIADNEHVILNDNEAALLPQVIQLLNNIQST
ncbi:MAG: dephospho-CoA kinase [Muribaculaceae bacterium]|nr:dephospho-CoA kinase [Muribaculaceae bacterium]